MRMLFVVLSICALSFSASALTLKEKKQYKEWQDYLKDPSQSYGAKVKEACGVAIPTTLDEKLTTPFMTENANAASYCDEVNSTLSGMCGDETSKTAIKSKIKKISCKLGKKGTAELKIAGGNLEFTFGPGASDLGKTIKDYLENHL